MCEGADIEKVRGAFIDGAILVNAVQPGMVEKRYPDCIVRWPNGYEEQVCPKTVKALFDSEEVVEGEIVHVRGNYQKQSYVPAGWRPKGV